MRNRKTASAVVAKCFLTKKKSVAMQNKAVRKDENVVATENKAFLKGCRTYAIVAKQS